MAKLSITFAAWKEGRVAPGAGEVPVVEGGPNTPVQGVAAVPATPERAGIANNLKQIGLAMHRYHDKHRAFPTAAIYGKDGKALLSWRVALLPYLGEEALYKEFKLDEPWDSPHNKKLLVRMPAVYGVPGVDLKHRTLFQVFTGPGTMFEGTKPTRLQDVTDGTANTILAIESGTPVPWTEPADLTYDAKQPLPKLGAIFENGYHALMADGSVRLLPRAISERILRLAIVRNDGVGFDDVPAPANHKK
jgi:hypothetical protein